MRHIINLGVVCLMLSLHSGCKNANTLYETLIVRGDKIELLKDTVPAKWKDKMENGQWTVKDHNGTVIAKGRFDNGLKSGNWVYHLDENNPVNEYSVNWRKYENSRWGVRINYPADWEIHTVSTRPFQASFETNSTILKDKYFVIIPHKIDSIEMNLDAYWHYYNQNMFRNDSVRKFSLKRFNHNDAHYYYSEYVIDRNNENILIISFLAQQDSLIYDIAYSSLLEERLLKRMIFLDMVRNMKIKTQRIFSPYEQVIKIDELDPPLTEGKIKPDSLQNI